MATSRQLLQRQFLCFNFEVPTELPGVDSGILDPRDTYADASEWEAKAKDLAERFQKNFVKYTSKRSW